MTRCGVDVFDSLERLNLGKAMVFGSLAISRPPRCLGMHDHRKVAVSYSPVSLLCMIIRINIRAVNIRIVAPS